DPDRVQPARAVDASRRPSCYPPDALRAIVGNGLGRGHERDRSSHQPAARQARQGLLRIGNSNGARPRLRAARGLTAQTASMQFEHLKTLFRSLRFRLSAWNTSVVLLAVVVAMLFIREGLRITFVAPS